MTLRFSCFTVVVVLNEPRVRTLNVNGHCRWSVQNQSRVLGLCSHWNRSLMIPTNGGWFGFTYFVTFDVLISSFSTSSGVSSLYRSSFSFCFSSPFMFLLLRHVQQSVSSKQIQAMLKRAGGSVLLLVSSSSWKQVWTHLYLLLLTRLTNGSCCCWLQAGSGGIDEYDQTTDKLHLQFVVIIKHISIFTSKNFHPEAHELILVQVLSDTRCDPNKCY